MFLIDVSAVEAMVMNLITIGAVIIVLAIVVPCLLWALKSWRIL